MAVNSYKAFDDTTAWSSRSEDNFTLEESNLTTAVGKSSAEECVLLSANNKSQPVLGLDENYNVNNNNTNFTATYSSVSLVNNTDNCMKINLNSQIELKNPNNNIDNTSQVIRTGESETNEMTINETVESLRKPAFNETVPNDLSTIVIDSNNADPSNNSEKNGTGLHEDSSSAPQKNNDSDSEVKISPNVSDSPGILLNEDRENKEDTNSEEIQHESTKDCEEDQSQAGEVASIDPEFVEERFRVDRRKMEQMLQAAVEGRGQSGEDFFGSIMKSTETEITWPSKLKIGAKSKKDPHIKVTGKEANVAKAKDLIMLVLDTKCTRVTLKMDVSHTEHSHVIGKGGNNIKRVMELTGCHIHFPDSNRNSSADKSNQVSIAGQPAGVESARAKIRDLLPIVVMFDLSMSGAIPDPNSPPIQTIVQQYFVSVQFKQRPKVYCTTTCTVRGPNDNVPGIIEGTIKLMQHLTGGSVVPVTSQMEVAPQQHSYMLGRNANNVKMIIQRTGAQIRFPDPNALPRKSTIFITGSVDSVVNARQKLMGCLPLVLMFDVKQEENLSPSEEALKNTQLMESLDIFISIKLKPRQPSKSVIIKSVERNIYNMFEARRQLLKLPSTGLKSPPPSSSPPFTLPPSITPSSGAPLIRLAHTPTMKPQYISIIPPNGVTLVNGGMSPMPPATPNSPMLRHNWASPMPSPAHSPYPLSQQATVAAIHAQQQQQHQLLLQFNAHQQLNMAAKSASQASSIAGSPPSVLDAVKPEFLQYQHHLIAAKENQITNLQVDANALEKEESLLQQQQQRIQQQNKEDWTQDQTTNNKKQFKDRIPSNVRGLQKHMLAVHTNFLDGTLSANSSFNKGRTEQRQHFNENTQEDTHSRNSFSGGRDNNNMYLKVSPGPNAMRGMQPSSPPGSDRSSPLLERRTDVLATSPDSPSRRFKSPSSSSSSTDLQQNLRQVQHQGKYLHPNHSAHLESKFNDSVSSAYRSATEAQNDADLQELDKYFGKVNPTAPPPGFEAFTNTALTASDYVRQKAQEAIKKRPVATEVRTPNNQWVGLGFSRSMPGNEIKKLGKGKYQNQLETPYEDEIYEDDSEDGANHLAMSQHIANSSKGGSALSSWRERNNYNLSQSLHTSKARELQNIPRRREHSTFDPMLMNHSRPTPPHPNDEPSPSYPSYPPPPNPESPTRGHTRVISNQPLEAALSLLTDNHLGGQSNCVELHDLLIHLHLEKYSDIFTTQEVDLQTFLTLTESDLTELGITAFGPRKKILLAIEELKKNRNVLYSSGLHAAPGGPTSSRPSSNNPQNSPPLLRPAEPTKNLLGNFLHNNGMRSPRPATPPMRTRAGVPHGGLSQRGLVNRGMVSQSGRW